MIRWFASQTVRHSLATAKHVQKILNGQRDILSTEAVTAVQASIDGVKATARKSSDRAELEKQMQGLDETAHKYLKPYPNAVWRENVEVLLVALAVAMAIRTFFLQPFKIPTGSMQPTLFGVTSENLLNDPAAKIPTGWDRVKEWFQGVSYLTLVAENDGELTIDEPLRLLIFNIKQTVHIGEKSYTLWFPPDYGGENSPLRVRAGLRDKQEFHRGDQVLKLKVVAGDHLFVDRMSYNFRPPQRGEIIVFETKGINSDYRELFNIPADQFYIKRLVGLGGEQIKLGDDRHLIIDGKRLDASTPRFAKVYGFNPGDPPADSHYSGHVNAPYLARFFQNKPDGVAIPKDHYMVMGDNTVNSSDSRSWGTFPATNVIGKAFFVYWPITSRFGGGYKK
jgi:signal peptidase I